MSLDKHLDMDARLEYLESFLLKIETPRESTTIENTAQIVEACLDTLVVTQEGIVNLEDLLISSNPLILLTAGANAVYLGLDPQVDAFITRLVNQAPTEESERAILAMLKVKTFKFTATHLCFAQKNEWPKEILANIGKFIVMQTKHNLLDGNIQAVVAILNLSEKGLQIKIPGSVFSREKWCCGYHWGKFHNTLPELTLPATL